MEEEIGVLDGNEVEFEAALIGNEYMGALVEQHL
jgi:hypothetical protein